MANKQAEPALLISNSAKNKGGENDFALGKRRINTQLIFLNAFSTFKKERKKKMQQN